MHVLITCQSYGIPCALVVFEGYLDAVAGNGMKYTDYSLGVGLDPITPAPVPLDLRSTDLQSLVMDLTISETQEGRGGGRPAACRGRRDGVADVAWPIARDIRTQRPRAVPGPSGPRRSSWGWWRWPPSCR